MRKAKLISRRATLQAGITVLAGGFATTEAAAQNPDAGKMSKSVVQYRYHPAANGSHCGICANFIPPASPQATATCKLVAGPIDPNGYCLAFAAKKKPA